MKDRIKQIRKDQKLTQLAFGEKLNISKSSVECVEYGRREPTDRVISDICRVFNVNEDWLRTGKGEMYKERTRESEIAELVIDLANCNDDISLEMARLIPKMSPEQIKALYNFMITLIEKDHP